MPSLPPKVLLICAIGLFIVSLFLPAFDCRGHESVSGFYLLLLGWLGFIGMEFRWLVNILLLIMLVKGGGTSKYYFLLPLISTLTALSLIVEPSLGCPAAGSFDGAAGLASGGYFWLASIIFASIRYIKGSKIITSNANKYGK